MIKIVNTPSFYSALYSVADFCAQNKDEEIEIVVPDKLSLFMEKFIFEHMHISSSFNIKVSTLNRFAKKKCVVDRSKQISTIGSIILINKLLNDNRDKFKIFCNKAYSFSYAENIFSTINQLKSSKIDYKEMKGFSSNNEQLQSKIADLQLIYELYENEKAGKLDATDIFLMSSLFVSNGEDNKKILFVGFDDFTAIEYSIIEQLAIKAEVVVMNYYSTSSNKMIYNQEIFSQLKNIAYKNELDFKVINSNQSFGEFKDFLHNNLFGTSKQKFLFDGKLISFFSGNGVASEIENVARNIRTQVASGKEFGNFGVAVFNLEQNISKIKEIFSKYEINYYIDASLSINKSIFYKFICSVLKYQANGYDCSNLIDIINSPFFLLEVEEKKALIEKLLFYNYGRVEKIDWGECEKSAQKLTEFLKLFEIKKDETVGIFVEKLKTADTLINFDEIMQNLATNASLNDRLILTKSKQLIFNLLEDISTFYENADLEKLLDIFTHVSNLVKFSNLPQTLDAAKVVDATNSMEIFEHLYIVNCTAENAPSLKFDCGIILDSEIEALSFKNKLAPTIAHINKLAKLRLFNLATMFETALEISYSYSPSELIKELNSKFAFSSAALPLPTLTPNVLERYCALSHWDAIEHKCKKKINDLGENVIKNKEISQISSENLKIYKNLHTISPSQLEAYFKCPFNYFLNNTLKISPRVENKLSSQDLGNIIHAVLCEYYKRNKNVGDVYKFCQTQIFALLNSNERLKLNAQSPIVINLIDELVRIIAGVNNIDAKSLFKPYKFEYEFFHNNTFKLQNVEINGKVDRVDKYDADGQSFLRIVDYKSGVADASLKELYYGNKLQLFLYALAMEEKLNGKVVGEFYLPLHNDYVREQKNNYSLKGFFLNDEQIVHALDTSLTPKMRSEIVNLTMSKQNIANKTIGHKELDYSEMERLKHYAKLVSENATEEIRSGFIAASPSDVSLPCSYCPYNHICLHACNGGFARQAKSVGLNSFKEEGGEDERV